MKLIISNLSRGVVCPIRTMWTQKTLICQVRGLYGRILANYNPNGWQLKAIKKKWITAIGAGKRSIKGMQCSDEKGHRNMA